MAPMWRRDEGAAVVERFAAAVGPYGCRLFLVGSVATRGWSDKDLDIELHVEGEARTLERVLGAIDAIRHTRHILVCHIDSQLMFLDPAFRAIEIWLHAPISFWRQVQPFTEKVWRRVRADKLKAVASVRRAREHGRPAGFAHVPPELFEQERNKVAAYISRKGDLYQGRRQHGSQS